MSNSVQPHRWQPTRLPCPWDSPGKNTGVGCHFLLQCMKGKSESHSVMSDSSRPHGLQPTRFLHPWDFPGKSTGVGRHCLLQPTFTRSWKKQGNSKKKMYFCFIDYTKSFDCITTNCGKLFKGREYQTCLLRNLYASQEET